MSSAAAGDAEFDFLVIGAGSAGAVVAARLSEGNASVLLVEAGPPDRSPWIHLPLGFSRTFRDPALNWMYESDPELHLDNRRIYWPKGKVLGGSSSINGLIWLRGLPSDYANWERLGCSGWDPEAVWPIFDQIECVEDEASRRASARGPLRMSLPSWRTELSEAFIDAVKRMSGVRRDDAFNAGEQLGGGYFLHTQSRGRRTSSTAYLRGVRNRGTLSIWTRTLATGLTIESGRVRGVRLVRDGRPCSVRARREIVLAGGAINTPQLLQLSGIGPAPVLERAGVRVLHALPGVGEGLHDHFTTRVTLRTASHGTTLNSVAGDLRGKFRVGWQWLNKRSGPLTIGAGVAGGYVRTAAAASEPDVQFILVPFKTDRLYQSLSPDPGFQILVTPSRPSSRGRLSIRSSDPRQSPSMIANYFATDADRRTVVEGLRCALELVATPELAAFVQERLAPLCDGNVDELLRYAAETGSSTQHQAGSCRMGDDELAVVDPQLRVRGLEGLRIADASVMPQVVSANTNAACFLIGERCAAFIRQANTDCFASHTPQIARP